MRCLWMLWTPNIVTDNIECTVSFWWRGQGRHSWFFHSRNAQTSSSNLDNNISWRCYRQKHRTAPIQVLNLSGSSTRPHTITNKPTYHSQTLSILSNQNTLRSLVSCTQRLCVSTSGLSRDGFTFKGTSSITVGHRPCHRWVRWWTRRGTRSWSVDCCWLN